ncbi:MAG: geranylgeranyl reductase family protein [Candidatus Thorarchaeota archaeon]
MYDLIVVGGGPSGAICARRAALKGLKVAVVDKATFPRRKLCGGAVSPRVREILDFDIDSAVEREIGVAVVYSPHGQRIVGVLPGVRGLMVRRERFDHLLLQKAREAGAEVFEGVRVVGVEQLRSGIRVLGEGDSFKAAFVVGADGVNSIVARAVGLRQSWRPDYVGLCIAADVKLPPDIVESITMDSETGEPAIELYLGAVKGGYGWLFPKRDEVSVGVGAKMSAKADLRELWRRFTTDLEQTKGVKLDLSGRSAFRVPLGPPDGRLSRRRCIVVGDAAGLVSPVTGEGIYYALKSGIIAANVVAEAVERRNHLHVVEYDRRIAHEMVGELRALRWLSNLIYRSNDNMERASSLAAEDPVVRRLAIEFLIGLRPARAVRWELVKHLARHYPLRSLRILVS